MSQQDAFRDVRGDRLPAGIRREPWEQAAASAEKTLAALKEAPLEGHVAEQLAEAVVASGCARLFGGRTAASHLVEPYFSVAAATLSERMRMADTDAFALPVAWRQAGPDEADALVARLLQARMDGWAAAVELVAAAEAPSLPETAADALEAFEEALDRFDRQLADREDLLATAVGTGMLDAWRRQLASGGRQSLPWWLDGRLESRAVAMVRHVDQLGRNAGAAASERADQSATVAIGHLLTDVRQLFVQPYAAAAAVEHAAAGRRLAWRSPDGDYEAVVVPPPRRSAVPRSAVLEFTTLAGAPASDLAGRVALLRGAATVIEPISEEADAAVVATFPGNVLSSGEASEIISLAVAGDGVWDPVDD